MIQAKQSAMTITGWCRYFETKKGNRVYDLSTLSDSKRQSRKMWTDQIEHLNPETQAKWLADAKFEKVTVTVEPKNQ